MRLDGLPRFGTVAARVDLVAASLESCRHDVAQDRIVVRDENLHFRASECLA
ncbi:hypothetical protein D3C83_260780 [compost metagenome]